MNAKPLMLAILLLGSGCAGPTIISQHVPEDSPVHVEGVSYYLPRALFPLTIEGDAEGKVTVTPEELQYVPDPAEHFVASFDESAFASDDLKIAVDSSGLLEAVNSTNEDQSVEITKKFLSLVTELAKIAPAGRGVRSDSRTEIKPFAKRLVFDPLDPRDVNRARAQLGNDFRLRVTRLGAPPVDAAMRPQSALDRRRAVPARCTNSLCFRLVVPVAIELSTTDASGLSEIHAKYIVLLPDPTRVAGYDIVRGPCIKRVTDLTFSKGLLTSAHVQKPSEVLGCLDIPLEIVRTVLSLPGELLTFRVEQINADTSLLQAQQNNLAAQQKLLEEQRDLVQASNPQASGG